MMSLVSVLGCGTWFFLIEEQLSWLCGSTCVLALLLRGPVESAVGPAPMHEENRLVEDPAPYPPQPLAAMRGTAPPSYGHARTGRSMSADLWQRLPSLVLISGIAAAYWATGRLALLLAIPPGYATAIWPPAGLAFAAILLCGARVWPGIVLGSFLAN